MDINTFVLSLLGGGTVGGIISTLLSWIKDNNFNKKERKIHLLDSQIRELYGPLYFLIIQSDKLFELNNRFHEAGKKEFVEKKYSSEQMTREILKDESLETIKTANKYIKLVESNNIEIKHLLDRNFSLIDPEDIDVFSLFYEHYIRLITEKDDTGKITTPLLIYEHVGEISFLRPEFIKLIKDKFLAKKNELDILFK